MQHFYVHYSSCSIHSASQLLILCLSPAVLVLRWELGWGVLYPTANRVKWARNPLFTSLNCFAKFIFTYEKFYITTSVKVLTRSRSSKELGKKSDWPPGFLKTFHLWEQMVPQLVFLTFNSFGDIHIQTWPQISTAKTIKASGSKSTDHFLKFYILKHFWNMKPKFHNKHFGGRAEPQNLMTEWAKGHWRLRLTLMARLGFLEFLGEFLGCWFSAFLHRLAAFVFPAEFGGSNCDITAFLNSLPNTSMWIFTLR